jgi:predicted nuclease of predicted toxin-antitoxin system
MRILADENVHKDIINGLRQVNIEVLTVCDIGLAGRKDQEILEYSENNNLILLSGDKDFGGLIKFAGLWGRGKVLLTRHHLINIDRIVKNVHETLNREAKALRTAEPIIIVISESGYRIHRPASS